jgi:activator of HSP90 ATPase
MAKVGEEDPRWIVRDLGDEGRNVGNWHWTEKNAMQWVKQRLNELFTNFQLYNNNGVSITTTQIQNVDGFADIFNRKG